MPKCDEIGSDLISTTNIITHTTCGLNSCCLIYLSDKPLQLYILNMNVTLDDYHTHSLYNGNNVEN